MTSTMAGLIIGGAVGMAQLIYIGSWQLFYWGFMPLIPIYSALGGALYGMILGGGGLLRSLLTLTVREAAQKSGKATPHNRRYNSWRILAGSTQTAWLAS